MSKDDIELHKDKGLNPHLTYCPGCGGEGPEIMLLGAVNKLFRHTDGRVTVAKSRRGATKAFGLMAHDDSEVEFVRELEDSEKLPGGLCDACVKIREDRARIVSEGGVYLRCAACGTTGCLAPDHPLAIRTREATGIAAPGACGIEVETCPHCPPKEEKSDG